MYDLAQVQDRWTDTIDASDTVEGRHAFDEDAALTPIFAALRRGGWVRRQREPAADPVEEFRRDPLTAPIPVVPAPSRSQERMSTPAHPEGRVDMSDRGRHHRRRAS